MTRWLRLVLIVGIGASCAAQPGPARWRSVEAAADDARCAFGTPYRLFHRAGADPSRLLIYFQGGGACWDWVSCQGMFDTTVEPDELADYRGIFDASNPANPFRDFAVLVVPYCTGDVHVGAAEVVYGDDVGARPVRQCGAQNAEWALGWAAEHLGVPGQVVIAGASAGSYGAIFHAPRIAALYPGADLVTIGDSGVPLLHEYEVVLDRWGAGPVLRSTWNAAPDAPLTLDRAYREAATVPGMRAVAQVTSDRDAVQSAFYLISGSPGAREASYRLLDRVERETPTVHSFVVAGADHGLMRTDAFYTYEAGGTSLAAWIGRLVDGEPVRSVRCAECTLD